LPLAKSITSMIVFARTRRTYAIVEPSGEMAGVAAPPNSPVIGTTCPFQRSSRLICQMPSLTFRSYRYLASRAEK
jgi:hypothetical protein